MFVFSSSDDIPNIEDIFKEKLNSLESSNKDSDLESHLKVKEFREKVWNIHHEGQPIPSANTQPLGDEDIVMSQVSKKRRLHYYTCNVALPTISNILCPLHACTCTSSWLISAQQRACLHCIKNNCSALVF